MHNLAKELSKDVKILKATRANMLLLLSKFSLEEVNRIPTGFNNNLAWNAGHCLVTNKLLIYDFCGHDTGLSSEMIASYKKGAKPKGDVSQEEWSEILEGLSSSVGQLKSDLEVREWEKHSPYTTSYGVTIIDARSGIKFNNAHEALHLGIMMTMGRLI